jgi:hypothetical protein
MSINKNSLSVFSVFSIALSLSACSGGGKSSDKLKPSDIAASVECDPWTENAASLGETNCVISVENKSSASGTIYISWDWKDGDKSCGIGGSMSDLSIGPNESGTKSVPGSMMCTPSYNNAVPTDVTVIVRPN